MGRARGTAPMELTVADYLRPYLLAALVATLVARPLVPTELAQETAAGIPFVVVTLAVAVVWLGLGLVSGRLRVRFSMADAAAALLVVLHSLAAVWAVRHAAPRPAINMAWEWIGLFASYLLARQLLITTREQRAVMAVMAALAVVIASYGAYQASYSLPKLRRQYLDNPERTVQQALGFNPSDEARMLFEQRMVSNEPFGTFALPNSLAGFLAPWFVVLLAMSSLGCQQGAGTRQRLFCRLVPLCFLPILAFCLALTKSRSAWLATAFGIVVGGWWLVVRQWRLGWRGAVVTGLIISLLLAAAGSAAWLIDPLLIEEAPKSFRYRVEYWRGALDLIAAYPLLGCGPGNFQDSYTRYKLPQASEEVADPHNFLIEVWATAGTPAALALLAWLGLVFWTTLKAPPREDQHAPATRDATAWIVGGLAGGVMLAHWQDLLAAAIPLVDLEWLEAGRLLTDLSVQLVLVLPAALLLHPWVAAGRLPAGVPALALAVLLIHLLVAGGIGIPGVAISVWLLAALALNVSQGTTGLAEVSRSAAAPWALLALLLSAGCYWTSYLPTVTSPTLLARARTASDEDVEQLLLEAQRSDPYATDPLWTLAEWELLNCQRAQNDEERDAAFGRFERYVREALALRPRSSAAFRHAADTYRRVWHESHATWGLQRRLRVLATAIDYYKQAIERYPNSIQHRFWLAVSLAAYIEALGDSQPQVGRQLRQQLKEQCLRTLELDRLTPHRNKKLPPDQHTLLEAQLRELEGKPKRNKQAERKPSQTSRQAVPGE